jgi:hypothetical protein
VQCNVSKDHIEAIKGLINLQKQRKVVIKRCDKGAGIIILNFDEYLHACNAHLNSEIKHIDGSTSKYYMKVNEAALDKAKAELENVLQEALDNNLISKDEHEAMQPKDKGPGKFYCTFKVHKEHELNKAPPVRPICSGCGSAFENVSKFVNHHIKEMSTQHPTYLEDTPDFLRYLETINEKGLLPQEALLATFDVIGLFTNIPHIDGTETVHEALEERSQKEVPTEFLIRLLELILENNIFEFDDTLWKQLIGAAMGSRPIPPYANIFMARKVDIKIKEIAANFTFQEINPLQFLKRFLDDFISLWFGSPKQLHQLHEAINKIHPNIKITMNHTTPSKNIETINNCDCTPQQSIPFLDTSLKIEAGQIIIRSI